jgi:acyl-CoA thioester hydrolase
MSDCFDYHHTVRPDEIDELGHANNVAYVEWMQSAAVAHSDALGWTGERYRRDGAGWVVRSHTITYCQPALAGDSIVVQTWVATMNKVTSLRRYRIVRRADESLLAQAETLWAFVDYATGRPARIPAEIAAAFPATEESD